MTRKPTLAAWAVTTAVREDPEAWEELVAAGRELKKAQRRALSGVSEHHLLEAMKKREVLLERIAGRAEALLQDGRRDPGRYRRRILDTLEAGSLREDRAQSIREGRLTRELPPPVGLGGVSGLALVGRKRRR